MALFEGPIVAVGKIAGEAEYLRPETDAAAAFDAWLEEGFDAAFERWAEAWRTAVRGGSPHAFMWWPNGAREEGPLCGVLAPSRDAVGRDYPLAVFARVRIEAVERAPHVLPLALGEFLDEIWRVIEVGRRSPLTRSELAVQLRKLPHPREEETARMELEYARWCRTVRLRDGWGAVLPAGSGPADPDDLVSSFARQPDDVLRLPLGTGGSAAVALWLDVVARIRGRGPAAHSAFWSPDDRALLISSSAPPPASVVGQLWAPETLARPFGEAPRSKSLPTVPDDRSMASFLATLAQAPVSDETALT